jgi:hypothetical protein
LLLLFAGSSLLGACSSDHPNSRISASPPSSVQSSPVPLTGAPASGSFSAPKQQLFAPYDENGQLVGTATQTATGQCWTSSIAIPIAGVFRCLADNTIYDPCFAPSVDTSPLTVTCYNDPWSGGTTMTLTKALPTENLILKNGDPWALELDNASRCVVQTGALPELSGNTLDYRCAGGTVASLQTSPDGVISVLYGSPTGPLTPVGVAVAWRGQSYRFGSTD